MAVTARYERNGACFNDCLRFSRKRVQGVAQESSASRSPRDPESNLPRSDCEVQKELWDGMVAYCA
jgi:hypothetical protein